MRTGSLPGVLCLCPANLVPRARARLGQRRPRVHGFWDNQQPEAFRAEKRSAQFVCAYPFAGQVIRERAKELKLSTYTVRTSLYRYGKNIFYPHTSTFCPILSRTGHFFQHHVRTRRNIGLAVRFSMTNTLLT